MIRRALLALLALSLVGATLTVPAPAPAAAAAPAYSCLPGHGLMSVNSAKDLMAGKLALGGGRVLSIGTTGDTSWARRTMNASDTRLLASMSWANVLVREYTRTGKTAYLDRARAFAADFMKDNPVGAGPRPVDTWTPMYTGQRASFLACLSLQLPKDATVRSWLASHGGYLARPANHGGAWNQGLEAAIGLLGAGCRLNRSDWRGTAASRLGTMITQSVDAQGALNEQAPGYVGFVHGRWQLAATKLAECGQPVPAAIAQRLPLLANFAAWSTAGDGRLVQIGDTFSEAPPVAAGPAVQYAGSAGKAGTPLKGLDAVYSAGYVFGRTTWSPYSSGIHWSMRFGPGRAFHGHDDHQSVTLTSGTRPVLVEGGFSGYSNAAQRQWQRSPEAHNVVVLPGTKFAGTAATRYVRGDGAASWRWYEVTDTAYTSSPRTRGLYVDAEAGYLLVQDRVGRASSGAIQQLWHLPTGTRTQIAGRTRATGTSADGKMQTVVLRVPLPGEVLPRGALTQVTGRSKPLQGWVSRTQNEMKAAPTVVATQVGRTARMVTLVVGVPTGTAVNASAARSGKGYVVTVDIGGKRSRVGISAGGGMWKAG